MKQMLLILGLLSAALPSTGFCRRYPAAAKASAPRAGARATRRPSAAGACEFTSHGQFHDRIESERAPLTVAHFLTRWIEGHYSTVRFFIASCRSFVIQAGGFDADYNAKPAGTKWSTNPATA